MTNKITGHHPGRPRVPRPGEVVSETPTHLGVVTPQQTIEYVSKDQVAKSVEQLYLRPHWVKSA